MSEWFYFCILKINKYEKTYNEKFSINVFGDRSW